MRMETQDSSDKLTISENECSSKRNQKVNNLIKSHAEKQAVQNNSLENKSSANSQGKENSNQVEDNQLEQKVSLKSSYEVS